MSAYGLQKLIRDVNRDPEKRARYFASPETFSTGYGLTEAESEALVLRDFGALYRFGVHGLLLRPFSILHDSTESDYLSAIRKQATP